MEWEYGGWWTVRWSRHPVSFLCVRRPWDWYFRVRGGGLSFRLRLHHSPPLFAERHGHVKVWRWGPLRVQVLRPSEVRGFGDDRGPLISRR